MMTASSRPHAIPTVNRCIDHHGLLAQCSADCRNSPGCLHVFHRNSLRISYAQRFSENRFFY